MARPLFTDFALSTLVGSINATVTSFVVGAGAGAKFPNPSTNAQPGGTFVVAIDNELILCSGKASDTITVWSDGSGHTGRGYAGTTAASHTNGATVVLSLSAVHLNQIWSALPDTFNPDVIAAARGAWNSSKGQWEYPTNIGTPSSYDEEFEGPFQGWGTPWNVSPRPTSLVAPDGSTGTNSGMTAAWGTDKKSWLTLDRASGNNDMWYIWRSFTPGSGSWTVQAKFSHGARINTTASLAMRFFVSDQSNPSSGTNAGNSVRLQHSISPSSTVSYSAGGSTQTSVMAVWNPSHSVSNTAGANVWYPFSGEQYVQISYVGGNEYRFAVSSDGVTYRELSQLTSLAAFTPASLGFLCYIINGAGVTTREQTAIDWVRRV